MSPSNSHGRGQEPLRRATRAESTRARRARRSWRTRKLGTVVATMPVVVVAFVGFAMASPFHHHRGGGQNAGAATACTNPAAGSSSANTGGMNSGGANQGGSNQGGMNTGSTSGSGAPMSSDTAAASASASASGASMSGASDRLGTYQNHSGGGSNYGNSNYSSNNYGYNGGNNNKHHNHGGATVSASPSAVPSTAAAGAGGGTAAAPSATATCQSTTTTMAGGTTMNTATAKATATAPAAGMTTAAAPAATPNPNCTLVVPPNPLTAQGLATPYQFVATDKAMGPCNEANANQSAFVQAAIYDPATGAMSLYEPLVIDMGTQPAAPTVVPMLPANAVVGIWFGFNATNLTLQDNNGSLNAGKCVNGLGGGDVFGQFAYCNAPAFFTAANAGIQGGMVKVPALGTATDGQPCLSLRDFGLIDQDQSDNVPSAYLANGNGQIAQKNAANVAALANATTIANPSDNGLLDNFVDPALGCQPWTVPDLSNNGTPAAGLPLDELQAAAFQQNPVALVPANDPMTLANNNQSNQKTNLYRMGADQPPLPAGQTPAVYCGDMDSIQSARLQQDVNLLINKTSPSAAAASNLFTFLGMRLQQSFGNLNCQNFGLTNPVKTLGMDGNGVVVSVVFTQTSNAVTGGAGNPAQKCANMNGNALSACALAAVGMGTPAQPSTAPMPTATPTAVPSGNMTHHSHSHWRW